MPWICLRCTLVNSQDSFLACEACGALRQTNNAPHHPSPPTSQSAVQVNLGLGQPHPNQSTLQPPRNSIGHPQPMNPHHPQPMNPHHPQPMNPHHPQPMNPQHLSPAHHHNQPPHHEQRNAMPVPLSTTSSAFQDLDPLSSVTQQQQQAHSTRRATTSTGNVDNKRGATRIHRHASADYGKYLLTELNSPSAAGVSKVQRGFADLCMLDTAGQPNPTRNPKTANNSTTSWNPQLSSFNANLLGGNPGGATSLGNAHNLNALAHHNPTPRPTHDLSSARPMSAGTTSSPRPQSNEYNADLIDNLFGECDNQRQLFDELLETEKAYVDALRIVVTHFLQPLQMAIQDGRPILPLDKVNLIFSNIAQILRVNAELLTAIEVELTKVQGTPGDALAVAYSQAFKQIIPYFKMYSVYINNYPRAIASLKACKQENPKFAEFLAQASAHNQCSGLDLGSYLIKPVQRLCKYPLFFASLLKQTDQSHISYSNIEEAAATVTGITEKVNLSKGEAERSIRSFEVANQLEGVTKKLGTEEAYNLLASGRVFVAEWDGYLTKDTSSKRLLVMEKEKKPRHFFLFSNVLVVSKKVSDDKYEFKLWIDLHHLVLKELAPPNLKKQAKQGSSAQDDHGGSAKTWCLPLDFVYMNSSKSSTTGRSSLMIRGKASSRTPSPEPCTIFFKSDVHRRKIWSKLSETISRWTEACMETATKKPTMAASPTHASAVDLHDASTNGQPHGNSMINRNISAIDVSVLDKPSRQQSEPQVRSNPTTTPFKLNLKFNNNKKQPSEFGHANGTGQRRRPKSINIGETAGFSGLLIAPPTGQARDKQGPPTPPGAKQPAGHTATYDVARLGSPIYAQSGGAIATPTQTTTVAFDPFADPFAPTPTEPQPMASTSVQPLAPVAKPAQASKRPPAPVLPDSHRVARVSLPQSTPATAGEDEDELVKKWFG